VAFLRFVLSTSHADSGVDDGIFGAAYDLCERHDMSVTEREAIREEVEWFEKHLPTPTRFNRTSSKGHYRRNTKGITWLRDNASEYLTRMHHLKRLLEVNGIAVSMIIEDRIGYVVYEDAFQVVAEPFADTRTSGT